MRIANEGGTHSTIVVWRMSLGEVIRQVIEALADAVTYPMIPHVHSLGALETDSVVGNTSSSGILSNDGRCTLWVAEVCKRIDGRDSSLSVLKQVNIFSLRGGRDYSGENDTEHINGTINRRSSGITNRGQVVQPTGARTGFGFREIRGIRPDDETHVAGIVSNLGIGVRSSILEEVLHVSIQGDCRSRLAGGKLAEGGDHSGINSAGIIKKLANDFLDILGLCRGERESSCVAYWVVAP